MDHSHQPWRRCVDWLIQLCINVLLSTEERMMRGRALGSGKPSPVSRNCIACNFE